MGAAVRLRQGKAPAAAKSLGRPFPAPPPRSKVPMSPSRLLRLLLTVLATVATAGTAAFGAIPQAGPSAPSFAGAGEAPLQAGAASGLIRVPVGAPLGGYLRPPVGGEYVGPDPQGEMMDNLPGVSGDGTPEVPLPDEARKFSSPYTTYSPPSRGYYDALTAKAVVLDDGNDVAVLLKTDLIGALDEVAVAVAEQVKQRTGVDIFEGLVLSASHTHGGPGAVANDSVRYFWLAMDAYQPELFDRLVGDLVNVVVDALDNRVPARFGFATGQESRDNALNSFRRSRSPWTPERVALQDLLRRRIGVLQIDEVDAQGNPVKPLAVVTNYAAHGIVFGVENLYFSGDALGAVEREIEASFDQPMVAMFVQSTGGDVSPRADGKPSLQRVERFGKLLAPQVLDIAKGIDNFDTQPDIAAASQRIALNRQTLGYSEGEYPYEYGAVQCNAEEPFKERCLPAPPPGEHDLADNGVAENDSFVPLDTRVTALRIGEAALLAQPGEPLAEYGLQLLEASPFGADNTFIWGYSQDHIGYLLPDSKEDWLLGGTEGTTTFWGWKLGARLVDVNLDLMAALAGAAPAPADELEVDYTSRPYVPVAATLSARPGRAVTKPAAIERFATTTFTFEGGDPVIDLPTVTVERLVGKDKWLAMRRSNGEIINTPYETHLAYRLVSGAHQWTVTFEAPKDWKAGTFRFSIEGVAATAGGTTPYALSSAPFEVAPSPSLEISEVVRSGDVVEATLAYTPRPDNYRLLDAEVPSDRPAPVRQGAVTFVTADGATITDDQPDIEIRDGLAVAVYRASLAGDGITATGEDAWGNTSG